MAMGLTQRQSDLLAFIRRRIGETGIAPSFQEMAEALSINSKSVVHGMISTLEERGHIRRMAARSRAIELVNRGPATAQEAIKALNDAAYLAAELARGEDHPSADALRRIALDTDQIVEGVAA